MLLECRDAFASSVPREGSVLKSSGLHLNRSTRQGRFHFGTFHWISLHKLQQLGKPASPIISMGLNWILEKWIQSKPRVSNVPSNHRVFRFLKITLAGRRAWALLVFIHFLQLLHSALENSATAPRPPPPPKKKSIQLMS